MSKDWGYLATQSRCRLGVPSILVWPSEGAIPRIIAISDRGSGAPRGRLPPPFVEPLGHFPCLEVGGRNLGRTKVSD